MIVRARVEVRLNGRTRVEEPVGLVEGLARMVVTGGFARWVEAERAAEAQMRRAVQGVVDAAAGREDAAVTVRACPRHPRGRAALEVDVVVVAGARGSEAPGAETLPARARRMLRARAACERELARAQEVAEGIARDVEAAARAALDVQNVVIEVDRGVLRAGDARLAGLPAAAAAWAEAVAVAAQDGGWLEALPADGGGVFGGAGPDGGGAFDTGAGDAGGGGFGA